MVKNPEVAIGPHTARSGKRRPRAPFRDLRGKETAQTRSAPPLGDGVRRVTTGLGAGAAGFGAFVAMVGSVFIALGAAGVADLGAKRANLGGELRAAGHFARGEGAKVGAAPVELDAMDQWVGVVLMQAGDGAAFASLHAAEAGLNAVVKGVVGHGEQASRVCSGSGVESESPRGRRGRAEEEISRYHRANPRRRPSERWPDLAWCLRPGEGWSRRGPRRCCGRLTRGGEPALLPGPSLAGAGGCFCLAAETGVFLARLLRRCDALRADCVDTRRGAPGGRGCGRGFALCSGGHPSMHGSRDAIRRLPD